MLATVERNLTESEVLKPAELASRAEAGERQEVIIRGDLVTRADYALAITESWQKTVLGILETGQRLLKAKKDLEHGEFGKIFEERAVPFCERTGQMLMAVARHRVLSNTKNSSLLPPHWGTLHQLEALGQPDARYRGWIADGTIHPEMERSDVTKLRRLCAETAKPVPDSPTCTTDDLHALVASGKRFGTIYADPPWQYGNKGLDQYGHAERHYQTMSMEELTALGGEIKAACEEDAVLFLWAPSPMLQVALELIPEWGFNYKTFFVWDKVKHNFGHYSSVRHEALLVATTGSCKPDVPELHDSVIEIEREGHSVKPTYFRELIDRLYPNGNRIELFARECAERWDAWGNQSRATTRTESAAT